MKNFLDGSDYSDKPLNSKKYPSLFSQKFVQPSIVWGGVGGFALITIEMFRSNAISDRNVLSIFFLCFIISLGLFYLKAYWRIGN